MGVIGRGVGCHLAEELIEGGGILRKLAALVEVRPESQTELSEPEAFIGRCLDFAVASGSPGAAAPRLVHNIDRKVPPQKERAKAFAVVGRRVPSFRELACAVQKDEQVGGGVFRNLVACVSVVAVKRLAGGSRVIGIVGRGGNDDGAAGGEAPLWLDDEGLGGARGDCRAAARNVKMRSFMGSLAVNARCGANGTSG